MLVPQKLGIEFNGLYWHSSEILSDDNQHWNKTLACAQAGLPLLHIFEDEWRDKRPIVESMIRHRLKVGCRKIYARSCKIVKLTRKQRQMFFNATHLDGDTHAAKAAYGLVYRDEIVTALSVREPISSKFKNNSLEIARYATALNTYVIGGLSRLIKHMRSDIGGNKSIMTYADRRIGTGAAYSAVGFTFDGLTKPRFWWTDFEKRYHRLHVNADKSRGLTQADVASELGLAKIYGCPNARFVLQ